MLDVYAALSASVDKISICPPPFPPFLEVVSRGRERECQMRWGGVGCAKWPFVRRVAWVTEKEGEEEETARDGLSGTLTALSSP